MKLYSYTTLANMHNIVCSSNFILSLILNIIETLELTELLVDTFSKI